MVYYICTPKTNKKTIIENEIIISKNSRTGGNFLNMIVLLLALLPKL